MSHYTHEYISTDLPQKFGTRGPADPLVRWIHALGAGVIVVVNEDGSSETFNTNGNEVIPGRFAEVVSSTCSSIRIGSDEPPQIVANTDASALNAGALIYGDGSDGNLHFDGTTTILGLAPSSKVYTLTRDIFGDAIVVDATVVIYANGFRIFAKTSLTNNGTIENNGKDASGRTAGAVTNTAGSLGIGTAGGAGANGVGNGSNGTALAASLPGNTGTGGAGGAAGAHTAGAGGTVTAITAAEGGARFLLALLLGVCVGTGTSGTASVVTPIGGGTGGGGGGADNADGTGGGGGGGGGPLMVAARQLVNNGVISSNGGKGGAGASTANNAGGGGGGQGGLVIVIARSSSGTGTVTATGGTAGAGVGTGAAGTAGSVGTVLSLAA